MILRKVSNLKNGDEIVLHDSCLEIKFVDSELDAEGKVQVHFMDAPARELFADDYVEIVIL